MDLKKMQDLGWKYADKFNDAATEIVMNEVSGTDDENKKTIAMFTARDMAIGAAMSKNKYLLVGGAIGIGATALTIGIVSRIKKLRKTKKEEI